MNRFTETAFQAAQGILLTGGSLDNALALLTEQFGGLVVLIDGLLK